MTHIPTNVLLRKVDISPPRILAGIRMDAEILVYRVPTKLTYYIYREADTNRLHYVSGNKSCPVSGK